MNLEARKDLARRRFGQLNGSMIIIGLSDISKRKKKRSRGRVKGPAWGQERHGAQASHCICIAGLLVLFRNEKVWFVLLEDDGNSCMVTYLRTWIYSRLEPIETQGRSHEDVIRFLVVLIYQMNA